MDNPDYSTYPKSYALCFLDGCKLKEQCAHYVAGQHVREDDYIGLAVFPPMLNRQEGCNRFQKLRVMHGAWGFDLLFENIKYKDAAPVRRAIKEYLGGNGTYSRYKRGLLLLTPEQQAWIINLFKEYGYTDNLQFDHYVEAIDW